MKNLKKYQVWAKVQVANDMATKTTIHLFFISTIILN